MCKAQCLREWQRSGLSDLRKFRWLKFGFVRILEKTPVGHAYLLISLFITKEWLLF